ncbi:hypothetical protein LCGC14_2483240 [marine sediment metagenome]|uniref:Uncharacterized protein n=1 Tax=marine sediment metagenome TaxID=412755 RepID=A0A0F9BUQ1_9ZZZZ
MNYQCVMLDCGECPACIEWKTNPRLIRIEKRINKDVRNWIIFVATPISLIVNFIIFKAVGAL